MIKLSSTISSTKLIGIRKITFIKYGLDPELGWCVAKEFPPKFCPNWRFTINLVLCQTWGHWDSILQKIHTNFQFNSHIYLLWKLVHNMFHIKYYQKNTPYNPMYALINENNYFTTIILYQIIPISLFIGVSSNLLAKTFTFPGHLYGVENEL